MNFIKIYKINSPIKIAPKKSTSQYAKTLQICIIFAINFHKGKLTETYQNLKEYFITLHFQQNVCLKWYENLPKI